MDYEKLEKLVMARLDAMSDEELNEDFRRYCEILPEDELPDECEVSTFDFGIAPISELQCSFAADFARIPIEAA